MFLVPVTRRSALAARNFDRLFDDFLAADAQAPRAPALDVVESDTAYTVALDVPGVAKDEVQVSIDGRKVSVQAQNKRESDKKDGDRIVYRERTASTFARHFTLAADVDQAASSAKLEHGVLTLTLVKRVQPSALQITVN